MSRANAPRTAPDATRGENVAPGAETQGKAVCDPLAGESATGRSHAARAMDVLSTPAGARAKRAAERFCFGFGAFSGRRAWEAMWRRLALEISVVSSAGDWCNGLPDNLPEAQCAALHDFADALLDAQRAEPCDLAGALYMSMRFGDKAKAQVFTPFSLAASMADLALKGLLDGPEAQTRPFWMIGDPAVGAGALPLALFNRAKARGVDPRRLFFRVSDLDTTCVDMAFVQLTYAGAFASVYWGDSLNMKNPPTLARVALWTVAHFSPPVACKPVVWWGADQAPAADQLELDLALPDAEGNGGAAPSGAQASNGVLDKPRQVAGACPSIGDGPKGRGRCPAARDGVLGIAEPRTEGAGRQLVGDPPELLPLKGESAPPAQRAEKGGCCRG